MASHLYDTLGRDLVDILKIHNVPGSALKDLQERLEIHLTEGSPEGEIPGDEGRALLMGYEQLFSALIPFCSDRKLTTSYDPSKQIIKIYPIH